MRLSSFFNMNSRIDIGIDLGTANTLIYLRGKGVVVNEPSIVARERSTGKILAVGHEALTMHERIHPGIVTVRPVSSGVIGDYEATLMLMKGLLNKAQTRFLFGIKRMVISVPLGTTEVELRAVQDAARHVGAKYVHLIYEPLAAAIGIGLDPFAPIGNMIVNIGGGTTEVAVVSYGGIASGESLRVAGSDINRSISRYFREQHNFAVSDYAVENIKLQMASATCQDNITTMNVRGMSYESGLPESMAVDSETISKVIAYPITQMVTSIKKHIEALVSKPELAIDILDHGIALSGGGALLKGLDKKIYEETKLPVVIGQDPLKEVIKGVGMILEDFSAYKPLLAS